MARREVIVLVCDLCESEDMVETHRVTVDGVTRDAEVCSNCWGTTTACLTAFYAVSREPSVKVSRVKAMEWPGTEWRFSSHALQRMGERHVTPEAALKVCDDPELRRPGKASDQEIWTRNGTKVVVVPERRIIVTVARQSDDDGE